MLNNGGRGIGIRALAVAGAFAVAIFTSAVTSSAVPMDQPGERHVVPGMEMNKPADAADVPGMDMDKPAGAGGHGATASPTKAPTSGDMPGMDMPADSSGHGDAPGADAGEAGGHGEAPEPPANRPLLPVLGTFGGGTAAVMLTAGLMRRKDREHLQVRQAARAARRSAK